MFDAHGETSRDRKQAVSSYRLMALEAFALVTLTTALVAEEPTNAVASVSAWKRGKVMSNAGLVVACHPPCLAC